MRQLTIGRLGLGDFEALERHLQADPVTNVYLRSELRIGPLAGRWWGVLDGAELRAAVLAGALMVPSVAVVEEAAPLADTMAQSPPPRMIVGPRETALGLHEAAKPSRLAREIREPQPLLTLRPDTATRIGNPAPVRRAQRADLDALITVAAAMHREEMGIDPLELDSVGWRSRMTMLVDRGWSWIWVERGEIVFKTELSAWTPDCVQLQGVYTPPRHRGRGLATAGLAAVCAELFRDVTTCSLYVNAYNTGARRLYDRLGFIHHSDLATVIF